MIKKMPSVNLADEASIKAMILKFALELETELVNRGEFVHRYYLWNGQGEYGHELLVGEGLPLEITVPGFVDLIKITEPTPARLGMIMHASEAWMCNSMDEDGRPPSQREDRGECYLIEAKTRYGQGFSVRQPFDRDSEGKIFFKGPPEVLTPIKGEWSRFLDSLFI